MVIEHTFVTTLDEQEAFSVAAGFLKARGFAPEENPKEPAKASVLQFRRGKNDARKARSVSELPQSIRLDFDRGRIALGCSITPSAVWGGKSWASSQIGTSEADTKDPKRLKLHKDLLLAVVTGLELLLVERVSLETASREWDGAELQIAEAARRRKRNMTIGAAVFLAFLAAFIGMIIYFVEH